MSTPVTANVGPGLGPPEVADMLDTLAAADRQLADELDRIATSRSPVSQATVIALERLLATLRPAAEVRAQLARVERGVLARAIQLRRDRHERLRLVGEGAQ